MAVTEKKAVIYARYPLLNILTYNGATVLHYVLGGLGIMLGYGSLAGYVGGAAYLVFVFSQMYVIMPLAVCPNCVYYRMKDARCVSALNLVLRKVAKERALEDFKNRGEGLVCHNNLYVAALVIPILALIPVLILDFSFVVLALLLAVVALMLFRFFVIFPKTACLHCSAKKECPNAEAMGIQDS